MKITNAPVLRIVLVILSVSSQFSNGQNWNSGARDIKWLIHCDFPGHDIGRIASPGENCGNLCIASPECTHFRHSVDGFCYLKKAPLSTPVKFTNEGACGFIPWKFESGKDHWNNEKSGVKWLINCDFPGHDIGRVVSTGEKCGGVCLDNPECNHFRFDGEICLIKKAPLSTSRSAVNGGVCGFIPSRDFDSNKPTVNSCQHVGGLESQCRPNVDFCYCHCAVEDSNKPPGNSGPNVGSLGSQCSPNVFIFIVLSVIVLL